MMYPDSILLLEQAFDRDFQFTILATEEATIYLLKIDHIQTLAEKLK